MAHVSEQFVQPYFGLEACHGLLRTGDRWGQLRCPQACLLHCGEQHPIAPAEPARLIECFQQRLHLVAGQELPDDAGVYMSHMQLSRQ